ncbi:hypothetical protein [Microbacterium sp.]|uniref:hypothetical protein n=1 Tax=Microbacterium sp. TaxID=51671 RepID=UPI003C78D5BF
MQRTPGDLARVALASLGLGGLLLTPGIVDAAPGAATALAAVVPFVPLAAALYLAVTVLSTPGRRIVLRRRYPLPEAASGA